MALEVTEANPGIYGTQFAGKEEALSGRFYEVLTAEGGQLFDDKWEPTFNSPAGVKAATMFADLYKAKAMPPDMTNFLWEDVAKHLANGTHRHVHRVVRLVQLLPGSEEQQGRRASSTSPASPRATATSTAVGPAITASPSPRSPRKRRWRPT